MSARIALCVHVRGRPERNQRCIRYNDLRDARSLGPLNRLAWNRLPGPYRFHYTTTAASLAIVQEKAYKVQARTRSGLYVTNLQPGQLSDEKLLNTIFDGMRDLERVQSAVVLVLDSSLPLEKVGAAAWCHRAPGGSLIDLDEMVVGRAWQEAGIWHYDRSLWDFPDSRKLTSVCKLC